MAEIQELRDFSIADPDKRDHDENYYVMKDGRAKLCKDEDDLKIALDKIKQTFYHKKTIIEVGLAKICLDPPNMIDFALFLERYLVENKYNEIFAVDEKIYQRYGDDFQFFIRKNTFWIKTRIIGSFRAYSDTERLQSIDLILKHVELIE